MTSSFVNNIQKHLKHLILAIKNDLSNSHKIALSTALGTYIGTCPFLGFHSLASIIAASFFKLNKTLVLSFSVLSFPLFLILLIPEVLLGAKISGIENGSLMELSKLIQLSSQKMGINPVSNWHILKLMIQSLGLVFYNFVLGWFVIGFIVALINYFIMRLLLNKKVFTKNTNNS